jgi:hypothetical protein
MEHLLYYLMKVDDTENPIRLAAVSVGMLTVHASYGALEENALISDRQAGLASDGGRSFFETSRSGRKRSTAAASPCIPGTGNAAHGRKCALLPQLRIVGLEFFRNGNGTDGNISL